jgi:hypothetical protein
VGYVLRIGVIAGVVIGILHSAYIFRHVLGDARGHGLSIRNGLRAFYYALWTVLLWALFGAYVLLMWIISVVAYGTVPLVVRLTKMANASKNTWD